MDGYLGKEMGLHFRPAHVLSAERKWEKVETRE